VDDDTVVPDPAEAPDDPALDPASELDEPSPPLDRPSPPLDEPGSPIGFLVALFVILLLAIVLIGATGDPYGAGCGGG
jgi:hypothetical protein